MGILALVLHFVWKAAFADVEADTKFGGLLGSMSWAG